MFTLAHLSDWHATSLDGVGISPMLGKRFFGWLSWKLERRHVHRPEVLGALFDDLVGEAPDHIAVTGDLTNVSLEQEFVAAARQLERLGPPERISLIPGNHDAYVYVPYERGWRHWEPYIASDPAESGNASAAAPDDFPTVRVRGPIALVGVCSAIPTPIFMASGRVGSAQLARLEGMLTQLRERGLCRVVLVHHPLHDDEVAPRNRLYDSAQLRAVLRRSGAELVLHGHRHRTILRSVAGPTGEIPVVGVRSASDAGGQEQARAQYHLYRIERTGSGRFAIELTIRGYDPPGNRFVSEGAARKLPPQP